MDAQGDGRYAPPAASAADVGQARRCLHDHIAGTIVVRT